MKDKDERLAKAAMKSLITPAPADLKASLKRMAREKRAEPSAWDALRELVAEWRWAYGAGAAFAAAAVAVVLVRAIPERTQPLQILRAAPAPTQAELADLWSDDDGGDHD